MDSLNFDAVQIYAIAVTIVAVLLGAALANERVAKGEFCGLNSLDIILALTLALPSLSHLSIRRYGNDVRRYLRATSAQKEEA